MPEQTNQDAALQAEESNSTANQGASTSTAGTSLLDLMRMVLADPQLKPEEKKLLIDELRKNSPGTNDRWTYRYAILALAGAVLLTIIALWALARTQGLTIPDGLVSIGSAAVGGLAGLLTPGRGSEN